jgi:hypothetical protein
MDTARVCTLASTLFLLGLCSGPQIPGEARAETMSVSDRVLTGEFVVTNAAQSQFRLVAHRGSFTAPAGTALSALDGKPVRVDLDRQGRVLEISQMPIRIEPVTHGFDVLRGELVVRDASRRMFTIAGDDHTYVAPVGTSIGPYAGRSVELRLDEEGRVMRLNPAEEPGGTTMAQSPRKCMFGDASVTDGSSICRHGATLRCADGTWVDIGTACS